MAHPYRSMSLVGGGFTLRTLGVLSRPPLSRSTAICFLQRWKGGLKDAVTVGGSKGATAEIEFVKGDFTVLDWSDGEHHW